MANKKYTITVEEDPVTKGVHMVRTNDGFTSFEVLGFVTLAQMEITQMIAGEMKPDTIERRFIEQV